MVECRLLLVVVTGSGSMAESVMFVGWNGGNRIDAATTTATIIYGHYDMHGGITYYAVWKWVAWK